MNINEILEKLQAICLEYKDNCPNYDGDYKTNECDCPLFNKCDLIYGLGFPCDLYFKVQKE